MSQKGPDQTSNFCAEKGSPLFSHQPINTPPFPQKLPLIMGVLNCTPDSFFDGGKYFTPELALNRALKMVEEGANVLDVGGESTRPGAQTVSAQQEIERVLPVIEKIRTRTNIPISIDTSKYAVAKAALEAGAVLINDVTGGTGDPTILQLAQQAQMGIILGHIQGTPQNMQNAPTYTNIVEEQLLFFSKQIACLDSAPLKISKLHEPASQYPLSEEHHASFDRQKIWIDPGIGFGKTLQHNRELLRSLALYNVLSCPLCIGVSRKSLIGATLGLESSDRLHASVALALWSALQGVRMIRVHDVRETWEALRIINSLFEEI